MTITPEIEAEIVRLFFAEHWLRGEMYGESWTIAGRKAACDQLQHAWEDGDARVHRAIGGWRAAAVDRESVVVFS